MVSCLLTRVILNVSVALTIQCYKPDGSIYNKTICSMMPSNLAKMEILRHMFIENNMSIPENLVTTPVELLEPLSDESDMYIDNEKKKFKFHTKSARLGSTKIHPYSIMSNNSEYDNIEKARELNKYKPHSLELNFNREETEPVKATMSFEMKENLKYTATMNLTSQHSKEHYITKSQHSKEQITKHKIIENDPSVEFISEKNIINTVRNDSHVSTTEYLSLHDQLAISLERHMQIIDDYEEAAKNKITSTTEEPFVDNTMQDIDNQSKTHFMAQRISQFVNKYQRHTKIRTLSDELAEHERIVASMQNLMDECPKVTIPKSNYEGRTLNTENIRYQFERKGEGSAQETDEALTTISLADRVNVIAECMNRQQHLHDNDFTTVPNELPNRIEKRSIPNTNPEMQKRDQQEVTTEEFNNNETELSTEDKNVNYLFPGVDNFWNVFITSPVEVILNSTNIYDRDMLYDRLKPHEKEYYDRLVKQLKETYQTNSTTCGNTDHCEPELRTEQSIHYPKQTELSDELSNILEHLENPSSLERNVARKILDQMKKRPKTTLDPKDRLSPENYAEFLNLKKNLEEQYNELKEHMNKTDNDVQRLIIEMRHLKEEKELNDYYEKNEKDYFHHSTPANYTDTVYVFDAESPTPPYVNPFLWENASDFLPDGINTYVQETGDENDDDSEEQYEILDKIQSFTITEHTEDHGDSKMHDIYYGITPKSSININSDYVTTSKNDKKYDYDSIEKYDKKKFRDVNDIKLKQEAIAIIPNISEGGIDLLHANLIRRLNKTQSPETERYTTKVNTETEKPWFEESVFDQNDPKILYAKYLHNVRNITVKLNMEVGKKQIRNITYFNKEDRRYAHQYKPTTECRRFSHIIPFWLTQPKEIEDVFKGNTKIFREYIQYILDKHNFTELPVHGRFAFLRRYINKLNNPLIFNRITIFPTAYVTTDHVLTFKEQMQHFKGHLKSKMHKAYKHVKHFLFNSSLDEPHEPVIIVNTETIPDEVIINITTPPAVGAYYDYY